MSHKIKKNIIKVISISTLMVYLLVSSLYADQNSVAPQFKIVGEKSVTVQLSNIKSKVESKIKSQIQDIRAGAKKITSEAKELKIKLFEVELSSDAKQSLKQKANAIEQENATHGSIESNEDVTKPDVALSSNSSKVDLGMNGVPVLNQGSYGTCVTFAVTATIDAMNNAGDFISQQCLLELGVHLSQMGQGYSGWQGNWNGTVLARIKQHGVISKEQCPHNYADKTQKLTTNQYDNIGGKLWANSFNTKSLVAGNIEQIKQALNNGHRIVIGSLLHTNDIVGKPIHGYSNGLWALPKDVNKYVQEINNGYSGGHAIIVIGYDDTTDMLKIRNSWGKYVGEKGDFYMTYDYYKLMAMEAYEVY